MREEIPQKTPKSGKFRKCDHFLTTCRLAENPVDTRFSVDILLLLILTINLAANQVPADPPNLIFPPYAGSLACYARAASPSSNCSW